MSAVNGKSGEGLALVSALRQKRISLVNGKFTPQDGYPMSFADAVSRGYINVKPVGTEAADKQFSDGSSLTDAIQRGLIDNNGKVSDQFSGNTIKITEAINRGILNQDLLEVYDGKRHEKVSLKDALSQSIIDETSGRYITSSGEKLTLMEAQKKNFICNPLTLKECDDCELIDRNSKIKDPVGNRNNMTILEAITYGLLDTDLKSVKDTRANSYVSLAEALATSVISLNGDFHDSQTGEVMSLAEAVKRGHLTTVARKSIFDIEGIKEQSTGNYISLNQAIKTGYVDRATGKLVDKKTKQKVGFSEAADRGLIQPQLLDMLKKPVGIKGNKKKELTLLEAVMEKRIDPSTGLLVDVNTNNTLPMSKALELNLVTPLGAAILKSLMNITVTTATVTQTVRRKVKVSSAEFDDGAINFQEALRRGLVDDVTGVFTHPETGKELALDEAISLGLLKLSPGSPVKLPSTSPREGKASVTRQSFSMPTRSSPDRSTDSRASPKRSIKTSPPARKDSQVESLHTSFEASHQVSTQDSSRQRKWSQRSSISRASDDSGGRTIPIVVEDTNFKGRGGSSFSISKIPENSRMMTLRDAITKSFLDPVSGIFTDTDTDINMNFKESIFSGFIDPESGSVTSPDSSRASLNLKVALERNFLNETAQYVEGRKAISLQQAIKSGKVRHAPVKTTHTASSKRSFVQPDPANPVVEESSSHHDTFMVSKNIRFNKSTKAFEVTKDITAAELLQALKEGKIKPTDIQVQDPKGLGQVNILEALQAGHINKSNGEYVSHEGKKLNILQAIQAGYITIGGSPNVDKSTEASSQPKTSTPIHRSSVAASINPVNGASGPKKSAPQDSKRKGSSTPTAGRKLVSVPPGGASGTISLRDGTISVRIIASGVTKTKISSFMVTLPSTGEEITLEEAVKRGLVSKETAAMYKQEVTTDSAVESVVVLVTDPETGLEMTLEEALERRVVTKAEYEKLLKMKDERMREEKEASKVEKPLRTSSFAGSTSTLGRPSSRSRRSSSPPSSKSNSSASSSDEENDKSSSSFRSELTIEIDKNAMTSPFNSPTSHEDFHTTRRAESTSHSIRTNIVNLKTGYALSNIDEVRNLVTGETMSLYEAKLRGIATEVKSGKADIVTNQLKMFISEAVSKGLVNFSHGLFKNPSTGLSMSLSEAIKTGLLITDFTNVHSEFFDLDAPTISLGEAIQHCLDSKKKTFYSQSLKKNFTLEQAVGQQWINGNDIIFDVLSSQQRTVSDAMKEGILNGKTMDYHVATTNSTYFLVDAAKEGLVAVFPESAVEVEQSDVTYTLKETMDSGIYQRESSLFIEISTHQQITIFRALKIGLVDFRSAEIRNTETGEKYNLFEAIGNSLLDGKSAKVKDVKEKKEYSLHEAYDKGLIVDRVVTPFESISFWEAIDNDQLDTETGMFFSIHEEKKYMTLEEAIYRKYIEKKSAFVKDTWKRKYCSLSEASRKKIIKDGRVMNTTTGKFLTIKDAINQQIIVRDIRSISLIDALDYGMYQPHSGRVNVPGLDREITLGEMIEMKLIDHTKTIVRSRRTNRYVSTKDAIRDGDIDPVTGMYGNMNLLEARSKGYLLSTDAMQAVQEKFRSATESLDDLTAWLQQVEREIAKQETVAEEVKILKEQIYLMKKIKQDLDEHHREVTSTLDTISELMETGSNVVSHAELNQLSSDGKKFKERFDITLIVASKQYKLLSMAYDELKKFSHEQCAFENWLEKAFAELEDCESKISQIIDFEKNTEVIKSFLNEVMTHGADLKFLRMTAQKYSEVSKDFHVSHSEFCLTINVHQVIASGSQISSRITKLESLYNDIVSRSNVLSDKMAWFGAKSKNYQEYLQLAEKWLTSTEIRVNELFEGSEMAEIKLVDDQLFTAKSLNNEILANGKLFSDLDQAATSFVASLNAEERKKVEKTCLGINKRYQDISALMNKLCTDLDTALIQSQSLLESIEGLRSWLEKALLQFDQLRKPASLIPERLDDQIRQLKLLQSDIDTHEQSIQKMLDVAQDFVKSEKQTEETKKIDAQSEEIKAHYHMIVTSVSSYGNFLEDVFAQLNEFVSTVNLFDDWYLEFMDKINSRNFSDLEASEEQSLIEQIILEKAEKQSHFESIIKVGEELLNLKNVVDTNLCSDALSELSEKWAELSALIDEKQEDFFARRQALNVYDSLKAQIAAWFAKVQKKFEVQGQIALNLDILQKQSQEIEALSQNHTEFKKVMEQFKEVSCQYDASIRKNSEFGFIERRQSLLARKRSLAPASFISPKSSIQSSARRESAIPVHLEMSPIQSHLVETQAHYANIGTQIKDREKGLRIMKEELTIYENNMMDINDFLKKQRKEFPKDISSTDMKEIENHSRLLKEILNKLNDNQFTLDETKVGIRDLTKKNLGAPGSDELKEKLSDVLNNWKSLQDLCKSKIDYSNMLKSFFETHISLRDWLVSKERMLNAFGPISPDARLIQSQLSQVKVIREDFDEKLPQKNRFFEFEKVLGKDKAIDLRLQEILKKWDELDRKIDERERDLKDLAGPAEQFFTLLSQLQVNLSHVSDDLDTLILSKDDGNKKRGNLEVISQRLLAQRPILVSLETIANLIQEKQIDAVSKQEIKSKFTHVEATFNNCQKKLENALAELDNSTREQRELAADCQAILELLKGYDNLGLNKKEVSARLDKLKQQVQDFEPIFHEQIMGKEHEIIILLNKGKEICKTMSKSDSQDQKKVLETIEKQWKLHKSVAQVYQKRLNSAYELATKFYSSFDKFIAWIDKAEPQLQKFTPICFEKGDLQKQEKDIQAFRFDINRHVSEFETTRSLGFTLIEATDIDKESPNEMLVGLKTRWDQLNNASHELALGISKVLAMLSDFYDNVRDLSNNLNRLESKVSKDEQLLLEIFTVSSVAALLEEARAQEAMLETIRRQAENILVDAQHYRSDSSAVEATVVSLNSRFENLTSKLTALMEKLKKVKENEEEFDNEIKEITERLNELDEELLQMKPVGRDFETLEAQTSEIELFSAKITSERTKLEKVLQLESKGKLQKSSKIKEQKNILSSLGKQLDKLSRSANVRKTDIFEVEASLEAFYRDYHQILTEIQKTISEEQSFETIGATLEGIKKSQKSFQLFQKKSVETLGERVMKVNAKGKSLIQSAAITVNTSILEKDLEDMNNSWNLLRKALDDRKKKFDEDLIKLGMFQEALQGLKAWFAEIDGVLKAQKAPSFDYKVLKAQIQEQTFLIKLVEDRRSNGASLISVGKEIASLANEKEKVQILKEVQEMEEKLEATVNASKQRMDHLESALPLSKEYQDQLGTFEKWLKEVETLLKNLEIVPSDESLIKKSMKILEEASLEIEEKAQSLDSLANVIQSLSSLVGDEDKLYLKEKLELLEQRFRSLCTKSQEMQSRLQNAMEGLRNLFFAYEELLQWLEKTEAGLLKFTVLSVFNDTLLEQLEFLRTTTEEIVANNSKVEEVKAVGQKLMQSISNTEAMQLKDKIDALQRKYLDLAMKTADLFNTGQEMLPLVQEFHASHNKLHEWLDSAEKTLKSLELQNIQEQEDEIRHFESEIVENKQLLDLVNLTGPKLCQLSPGEGSKTLEELVLRDNNRFENISKRIRNQFDAILMSKKRSTETMTEINELLIWFQEVELKLQEADAPPSEPDLIRELLNQHKELNDEISSQRGRSRDILTNAQKFLRESVQTLESESLKEIIGDLKQTVDSVVKLSSARMSILEQALPLSVHFYEIHQEFSEWLTAIEQDVMNQILPVMRVDLIAKHQEVNNAFLKSVQEHKVVLDRINKTGGSLISLVNAFDSYKVQEIIENDNQRYNSLKTGLREMQQALEEAMQECSQFTDQLNGLLNALTNTSSQINNAEPISAHPEKIKEQIDDNNAIVYDLENKRAAYEQVKTSAEEVFEKAAKKDDVALEDIRMKLEQLNKLWTQIESSTNNRSQSLSQALCLAEEFWAALQQVLTSLKNIEDCFASQQPPGIQPKAIGEQQLELKQIKTDIDTTKPSVDNCLKKGHDLLNVIGEPEKPEIKQHLSELKYAWENITSLYAKRESDLIVAMEKAMEFYDNWQKLLEFLETFEKKFNSLKPISSEIDAIKEQIEELKLLKNDTDPWMVKIEAMNRQAQELAQSASSHQADTIRQHMLTVTMRWEDLDKMISIRQQNLEKALLHLGQFEHALSELMTWIEATDRTLDTLIPRLGDPQAVEVELAKLKILENDIRAHQLSVDTLNNAGRQLLEAEASNGEASQINQKLTLLNSSWNTLLTKVNSKQVELVNILKEAQLFMEEIRDMTAWLNDVDAAISASKPVGGLPETAQDQLDQFMELYSEVDTMAPKVNALLQRGEEYIKRSSDSTNFVQNSLRSLKTLWDNVLTRLNDKKIKLEIALKEATEFHNGIQTFMDWLTKAEQKLTHLEPVSRLAAKLEKQIQEHKEFQEKVASQREFMLSLEKKATNFNNFAQKQDKILIKNLLTSVQTRWQKIVSLSEDHMRSLETAYEDSRDFQNSWDAIYNWLSQAEIQLKESPFKNKNDAIQIKKAIQEHKLFQKELSQKHVEYDGTMKKGKHLLGKAPKSEELIIQNMLTDLKNKWIQVSNFALEKEKDLEDALLVSGQFKDAMRALLNWLAQVEHQLDANSPVHGDLETVTSLIETHKNFEKELALKADQMSSIRSTAESLQNSGDQAETAKIRDQIAELCANWEKVNSLCKTKSKRLDGAHLDADELQKHINSLLEWFSHAETKLRFSSPLSEDEEEVRKQIEEHEKFMAVLKTMEKEKDLTLKLAYDILSKCHPDAVNILKQWITILQSRWDEVSSWAMQRYEKLTDHFKDLKNTLALLDQLMKWLTEKEKTLEKLEEEQIPDDVEALQLLIVQHQEFMDNLSTKQPEIDDVCKPSRPKSVAPQSRKQSKAFKNGQDPHEQDTETHPKPSGGNLNEDPASRRSSRYSTADHPFSDRKASKFPDRKASFGGQDPKSPRALAVWDKWRKVWMMAWERDRRLKDKLAYVQELEKVKNFDWDEWRKRFLKHHNNRKSRVTDLFRKMDESSDNRIPREVFVDGILKNKFPSSKLEMNTVADKFDPGDGKIDWRSFMAALRPDWQDRGPLTDAERIDDEINRQVALCTCKSKFKVMQIGEGKYRFGDSQKLRLVRILRSTVMVRVGGGWCSLEEFLVKNDPCRAKGRTNVELREQFVLADGVSQGMASFKPKMSISAASPDNSVSGGSMIKGPITKIKEKSEKSIPMSGPSSLPSSYVEQRRQTQLSGGRPGSRAGSNLSLNSEDSPQSGTSIRRSSSMRSGGSSSLGRSSMSRPSGRPSGLPLPSDSLTPPTKRVSSTHSNGRS